MTKKVIKLLAAKRTTYIEVNTLSINHIYSFLFQIFVFQRATSDPKIISRMENAKKIRPTTAIIVFGQK